MSIYKIDEEAYQAAARLAVAESCVLLKNENKTLPLEKGDRVAVFGRMAANYYKSGLGSGGLVNTRYVVGILDALKNTDEIKLDRKLLGIYEEWNKDHPLDKGHGWGQVPWSQEEMPIEEEVVRECAEDDDVALIVIGRTAGEDQDNTAEAGGYFLTETEKDLIAKVCRNFKRAAVLLNVGNIIDMNWVEELGVPCVMYVWQGGQEGGNGVADILLGLESPSGKLTDTIANSLSDYPSHANFGDAKKNRYEEDIYVGYRYFETFARDKVLYPFGYGLSYTDFQIEGRIAGNSDSKFVTVDATVINTGEYFGKEVVQLYVKTPQGKLGKPHRVLAGFDKTRVLEPGDRTTVLLMIPKYNFASFDDSGVTGHRNAYVLEEGTYEFYLGSDVRSAKRIGSYEQKFKVIEQLEEAFAPVEPLRRMKPQTEDGESYTLIYEDAPLRTVKMSQRMQARMPQEINYSGDKGITMQDLYEGKADMDEFLAQLSAEDLIHLFRGEGMASPKVTPGTGSAFGGLSPSLKKYKIPALCSTDGPSGIRMDCGTNAFSLPSGTALGATFNMPLVEELYSYTGKELRKNRVDALLGPGMNIHRHPLNGRNFEYISEDPLLTGRCAAAQVRGLSVVDSTATIKHFCANNQEFHRNDSDGVISQRALREIYLKGFEIAVKEGKARSVMTTYGSVNNIWTASNYDLCTTILRGEWKFDGIVMTDWWAKGSEEGSVGKRDYRSSMVTAGNDLYMVTPDQTDDGQDNVKAAYEKGDICLAQLQENARHILGFALKSTAMQYELGLISQEELDERAQTREGDVNFEELVTYDSDENGTICIEHPDWKPERGSQVVFATNESRMGIFNIRLTVHSELDDLAQLPVTVYFDSGLVKTFTFQGSNGKQVTQECELCAMFAPTHYVKLYFGADGLEVDQLEIYWVKECHLPFGDFES